MSQSGNDEKKTKSILSIDNALSTIANKPNVSASVVQAIRNTCMCKDRQILKGKQKYISIPNEEHRTTEHFAAFAEERKTEDKRTREQMK
jgi:hypothetical protein